MLAAPTSFVLRIDEPSVELARLHQAHGVASSAFLTAWNPYSQEASDADNQAAQARLLDELTAARFTFLEGEGVDPSGRWKAERSVLVLGMPRAQAEARGRDFQQNALVFSERDAIPRLVLLR